MKVPGLLLGYQSRKTYCAHAGQSSKSYYDYQWEKLFGCNVHILPAEIWNHANVSREEPRTLRRLL
jgi:hypothetical protein